MSLAATVVAGVAAGHRDLVVNAVVGLVLTGMPAISSRRWDVTVPASLVAWLAAAVALHVGGMLVGAYEPPTRYDDLTHAASGTVLAAVGYVAVAAWDRLVEDLYLPRGARVAVALVVVAAGGVTWEIAEFVGSGGGEGVQTSLHDTVTDLGYNLVGGVVALAATRGYLERVAADVAADRTGREPSR